MTYAKPPPPIGDKPPSAGHWGVEDTQVFGAAAAPPGPVDAYAPRPRTEPYADHFLGGQMGHGWTLPVHLPRPWLLQGRSLSAYVLTQGSSGEQVRQLQQLLNGRIEPSPGLQEDGIFGARTLAAVVALQRAAVINANGQVGKETWLNLLFREKVRLPKQGPANVPKMPQSGGSPFGRPTAPTASQFPSFAGDQLA